MGVLMNSLGYGTEVLDLEKKIKEVEQNLLPAVQIANQPPNQYSIDERMAKYRIPSISIAVINEGKLEWAKAYGVKKRESDNRASTVTLYQAGSVSKPVAAVGALILVQEGRINLDDNINEILTSWQVPLNEYTKRRSVTLCHLLNHSAGFNVIGFDGYRNKDKLPSLFEILEGLNPANNPSIHVGFVPGTTMSYSGGGYVVLQQLIEDVKQQLFCEFMQQHLLLPLHMLNSTFECPLPSQYAAEAAYAHPGGNEMEGGCKNYPESATAGLWTTPTDLSKFIIAIQKALQSDSSIVLKKKTAEEMVKRSMPPYGLGPLINGEKETLEISHTGRTDGFVCGYVSYPYLGKGAVVMMNSDNGGCLVGEILRAISTVYTWPSYHAVTRNVMTMNNNRLDFYLGRYSTGDVKNDIYDVIVSKQGDGLVLQMGVASMPYKLHPVSEDNFFVQETGYDIFFKEEQKQITSLKIIVQEGFERTFRKLNVQ